MIRFFILFLVLSSCSSQRTLSDQERERLGLNGIAYDVRICQGGYNQAKQDLDFAAKCEVVNCEPVKKKIVCKAKPEQPVRKSK